MGKQNKKKINTPSREHTREFPRVHLRQTGVQAGHAKEAAVHLPLPQVLLGAWDLSRRCSSSSTWLVVASKRGREKRVSSASTPAARSVEKIESIIACIFILLQVIKFNWRSSMRKTNMRSKLPNGASI